MRRKRGTATENAPPSGSGLARDKLAEYALGVIIAGMRAYGAEWDGAVETRGGRRLAHDKSRYKSRLVTHDTLHTLHMSRYIAYARDKSRHIRCT